MASDLRVCPSLPRCPCGVAISAVFLMTKGILVIAAAIQTSLQSLVVQISLEVDAGSDFPVDFWRGFYAQIVY